MLKKKEKYLILHSVSIGTETQICKAGNLFIFHELIGHIYVYIIREIDLPQSW